MPEQSATFLMVQPDGTVIARFEGIIVAAPGSSIPGTVITPDSIDTDKLKTGSVDTRVLAADSVTADEINVNSLASITSIVGFLATSSYDPRIVIDGPGNRIYVTNSNGDIVTRIGEGTGVSDFRGPTGSAFTMQSDQNWHAWQSQKFFYCPDGASITVFAVGSALFNGLVSEMDGSRAFYSLLGIYDNNTNLGSALAFGPTMPHAGWRVGIFNLAYWKNDTGAGKLIECALFSKTADAGKWGWVSGTGYYVAIII